MRFRNFSRLVSDSHTHTLERVMDFFEWNDLSPNDDLGINNNRTNKRINAVIAILKNIEKHQTLPTKAMLDTLFQVISNMEDTEEKEEKVEKVALLSPDSLDGPNRFPGTTNWTTTETAMKKCNNNLAIIKNGCCIS